MDLDETVYVPSFRRNLIYISSLDKSGYTCSFGHEVFSLYQNSNIIGTGYLVDSLYKLDLDASHLKFNKTLHVDNSGTKQKLINENSSVLWLKLLELILLGLCQVKFLIPFIVSDFKICVESIKGKQTKGNLVPKGV